MQEADLVLVVGTKLGEVATAGWTVPKHDAKVIHIDIDAAVIGRNYRTKVGIWLRMPSWPLGTYFIQLHEEPAEQVDDSR